MNIMDVGKLEYYYIFEIDNIKRALFIIIKLQSKLDNCNEIDKADKRRII